MESEASGQKYVPWFLLKEKVSGSEIVKSLNSVCGDDAPSTETVYRCIVYFKGGKETTLNEPRSGRPSTTCSKKM